MIWRIWTRRLDIDPRGKERSSASSEHLAALLAAKDGFDRTKVELHCNPIHDQYFYKNVIVTFVLLKHYQWALLEKTILIIIPWKSVIVRIHPRKKCIWNVHPGGEPWASCGRNWEVAKRRREAARGTCWSVSIIVVLITILIINLIIVITNIIVDHITIELIITIMTMILASSSLFDPNKNLLNLPICIYSYKFIWPEIVSYW